jgi:hypothetical protein
VYLIERALSQQGFPCPYGRPRPELEKSDFYSSRRKGTSDPDPGTSVVAGGGATTRVVLNLAVGRGLGDSKFISTS